MEQENKDLTVVEEKPVTHERGMFEKLQLMVTNGKKLSQDEAVALAQFSVAEGLDPFNQECFYIPKVGPVIGIKGLRKKAEQQIKTIGPKEYYNITFKDISKDAQSILKDPEIQFAFIAVLKDTVTFGKYISLEIEARAGNIPADRIQEIIGDVPSWEAIGFWKVTEGNQYKDQYFHPIERAKKRAEALVLRKRFNINANYADNVDGEMIIIPEEQPEQIEAEVVEPQENTLRTTGEIKRVIANLCLAIEKHAKENGGSEINKSNRKGVMACLNSVLSPGEVDMKRHILLKALFGKTSSKDLNDLQWAALNRYMQPKKLDSGEWGCTDQIVEKEISNIVAKEIALTEGMETLFPEYKEK